MLYSKEELESIVKSNKSKAECLRALNKKPVGSNYKWFDKKIKEFDLNISHFTGKGWSFGKRFRVGNKATSLKEILVENSTYSSTYKLKLRLFKEGIKQQICEECKNTEWNGKPIPLELEHCNGNNTDNRIENLKVLCPNCHAQTPFYRGRNKLSCLNERREQNRVKFGETLLSGNTEPSPTVNREGVETLRREPKAKSICKCGQTMHRLSKKCRDCDNLERKTKRPEYNQLIEDFKQLKTKVKVGKKYGVSDNAVKKWLELYQIDLDMVKIKSSAQTEMVAKAIV